MSDIRDEGEARPLDDEDRLPWLEAVEEDEREEGPSIGKLVAAVVVGLVAIGLVVSGLFWLGNRGASGDAELIAAEEGDYKVRPDDPGGMEVEGEGDTSYAASEGADPKGNIDVAAVSEAPVTVPKAEPKAEPKLKAPPPTKVEPAPKAAAPAPKAAPAASGPAIQLGAFSSQGAANNAWKALSGRFTYLKPLSHSVTPASVSGRTLYRLRASGPNASNLCGRLRAAGESCVDIG